MPQYKNQLAVWQKLGGPTQRVLLRFHKLTTTADSANDKLTITIFARKNLPARIDNIYGLYQHQIPLQTER